MSFVEYVPPTQQEICRSSEHNPPGNIVLQAGQHTWQCPSCGHKTTFYVMGTWC